MLQIKITQAMLESKEHIKSSYKFNKQKVAGYVDKFTESINVASHIYTKDMSYSSPTIEQCSHNETRASTAFEPNPSDPLSP